MLDGIPLLDLTPAALVGVTVILLLTGRLVPKTTLDDKIQEVGQWRSAYEKEREARALSDKQTTELLEVSKTTKQLIEGLFQTRERLLRSGEDDVSIPKT